MTGGIFDMDGLLVDTERLYQRVWRQLAAERGFELPGTFAAEICGKGEKQAADVLRRYFPGYDPEAIIALCKERVVLLEETELTLKPGAADILAAMKKRGFRLAVASSSPMSMVRRNLAHAGILDFFDALTSGETIERGKPFPDIFLAAAASIALPAEECYVFEDSLSGIIAADAAGCTPVMIPDLVQPPEDIRAICHVFPDLSAARVALLAP